jgi:hypothetical protein
MEDVIGIRVRDSNDRWFGFMTYPEICQALELDGEDLLSAAKPFMTNLEGMAEPVELVIFPSVRAVEDARYFYQGLFKFCWSPRPSGKAYPKWRDRIVRAFRRYGYWLYFLGPLERSTCPSLGASAASE